MNIRFIASAILTILLSSSFVFGDCEPNWKSGNGPQGVSDYVMTLINWDPDGNGPQQEQLVASGRFTSAGGVAANRIAAWDGNTWEPLGSGLTDMASALAVYNGELVAGGWFTTADGVAANYIARWNGSEWKTLDSGINGPIYSLAVYNGLLFAGGDFITAGGVPASRIACWDGNSWQAVSSGMNERVWALTIYDGNLIAGGSFTTAGGIDANRMAQWDGSNWQTMNSGTNSVVRALTVYNEQLVAGGSFTTAGGVEANYIAQWNGNHWQPLDSGMNNWVNTLTVYDGNLVAGGSFRKAGGVDVNGIARWDGSYWQPLGGGTSDSVYALAVYNGELIAGGYFIKAGAVTVNRIGLWDGSEWRTFGNGLGGMGANESYVQGLTVYKNELIAIGVFPTAGGIDVNGIARWNGSNWQNLGSGLGNGLNYSPGYAVTVYSGELIAGGGFTKAGGVDANRVARWDGNNWQSLGDGVARKPYYPRVRALTVYDGELIAGGDFNTASSIDANGIAAWNGEEWLSLGSGIREGNWQGIQAGVLALTVYNGELIAGGDFTTADGIAVDKIARWNGSSWQPVGSGLSSVNCGVSVLTVYDGKLIAGLIMPPPGGKSDVNFIASWDGNSWQQLGRGFNSSVYALTVYNDELIAGGSFAKSGDVNVNRIARWDGSNWQPLGSGMGITPSVSALTSYNGELIAGGWFTTAGGIPSVYWARWGVPEPIDGDLNHDYAVDLFDLKLLVERWLNDDCLITAWCYETDLNYDLAVDFADFSRMADNWLKGDITRFAGDFDNDGRVDMSDMEMLCLYWLQNKPELDIAPLGGDSIINFFDFAPFAANWLEGL